MAPVDVAAMTLRTPPVHTEPETVPPALGCSAVIHRHGLPPGVLHILQLKRIAGFTRIAVKAHISAAHGMVHLAAVPHSLTTCFFVTS